MVVLAFELMTGTKTDSCVAGKISADTGKQMSKNGKILLMRSQPAFTADELPACMLDNASLRENDQEGERHTDGENEHILKQNLK